MDGGPDAVIDALLDEGCTVMVPTFSAIYAAVPPEDPAERPARNGWDYANGWVPDPEGAHVFTCESRLVNKGMGVIPATVLQRQGRMRGNHPLNSFTSLGPLATALVGDQAPLEVYAPLRALALVGSCSLGFGRFEPVLAPLCREERVGESRWLIGPAAELLAVATERIRQDPAVTHCGDPACVRCNDSIAGGPLV